jgi:hypothetical protein
MHLPDGSELSLRDCTVKGLYQEVTGLAEEGAAPSKPSTANSVEGSQKQSTIRASDSFVQVSTEVLTHSALAPRKSHTGSTRLFCLISFNKSLLYFEMFFVCFSQRDPSIFVVRACAPCHCCCAFYYFDALHYVAVIRYHVSFGMLHLRTISRSTSS